MESHGFMIGVHSKPKILGVPRDIYGKKIVKQARNPRARAHPPDKSPKIQFKFFVDGLWKIPSYVQPSESVRNKFISLSYIFNYDALKNQIHINIKDIKFKTIYNYWPIPNELDWASTLPTNIQSMIQSYYAKQEQDWNKVRGIYFKLFKIRKALKPLVYRWRVARCLANCKNTEDPVTLEVPKKPVYMVDIKHRISFVFDAKTMKKTIENRILQSDYMFAEPLQPVNPLTNMNFTYGQLVSIIRQCREQAEYSWILQGLYDVNCNFNYFARYYKKQLNLEAIKTFFGRPTIYIRETVIDFFEKEADLSDFPMYKVLKFRSLYDTAPETMVVKQWIKATKDHYIAKELNDVVLLAKNARDVTYVLSLIYYRFG